MVRRREIDNVELHWSRKDYIILGAWRDSPRSSNTRNLMVSGSGAGSVLAFGIDRWIRETFTCRLFDVRFTRPSSSTERTNSNTTAQTRHILVYLEHGRASFGCWPGKTLVEFYQGNGYGHETAEPRGEHRTVQMMKRNPEPTERLTKRVRYELRCRAAVEDPGQLRPLERWSRDAERSGKPSYTRCPDGSVWFGGRIRGRRKLLSRSK